MKSKSIIVILLFVGMYKKLFWTCHQLLVEHILIDILVVLPLLHMGILHTLGEIMANFSWNQFFHIFGRRKSVKSINSWLFKNFVKLIYYFHKNTAELPKKLDVTKMKKSQCGKPRPTWSSSRWSSPRQPKKNRLKPLKDNSSIHHYSTVVRLSMKKKTD